MVDQADEKKKGTDTARPPKGDEASDLYSSATVVRDTPSDLKDLIKQSNEGSNRPVTVPPNSRLPKDLTGDAKGSPTLPSPSSAAKPGETSQTAKTAPPPSSSRKNNEPPLSARKPDAPKKPDVPNKVDDLWEALLPKRSMDDDDDDDDDGPSGSASGHAAEDVTKMLMVPEGLLPEDPLEALSPDALRRIAEAQPSIVVDAGIPATHSTVPPKKSSVPPPRMSSEPPPSAAKPRKKDDEDEGMVTSPGRNVPPSDRERIRSMVLAIGALVLLAIAVYYVAQP
ncbi:MAG: hypothetical protein JWM74_1514 [Myxococcaceae bacterium]|jgi:hypothetical protein|nr:hypothetical protein [Myxococcaceae bacterium]